MAADFKVLRGTSIIASGNATLTLTEGTDYTLESGVTTSDAFVRIVSSRLMGMGRTASGGNQNVDDFGVYISSTDITSGVTFTRLGTSNNCRVCWEIIQYTGPSGGDNEFIVREVGTQTVAASSYEDTKSITGVSDHSDVVPFITGQTCAETSRNDWHGALHTASYSSGTITFRRGDLTDQSTVSYAAVEFTGSNWSIQTGEFTQSTGSLTISSVTTSKTFLHVQYRYERNGTTCGLDDAGNQVVLANSTTVQSQNETTSTDAAYKYHRIWVIENTQTGDGAMSVEHIASQNVSGTGVEEVGTEAITSVDNMDQTCIMGETANSTGGGTAYPRGCLVFQLTAVDTVTWRQSDAGQTSDLAFQVVQLPTAAGATNATVEPSAQTITATTPAPSILATQNPTVSASAQTVTATAPAPGVSAEQNATVEPSVQTVTATAPAPSVLTEVATTVEPSAQTVTATAPAPSVSADQNPTVGPSAQEITASAPAPSVVAEVNTTVVPRVETVTLTAPAPGVAAEQNATVTPSAQDITPSAPAPGVAAEQNATVTPSAQTVTSSAPAPSVTTTQNPVVQPAAQVIATILPAPYVVAPVQLTARDIFAGTPFIDSPQIGAKYVFPIRGSIVAGGRGGVAALNWGSGSSSESVKLHAGSWIRLTKVG